MPRPYHSPSSIGLARQGDVGCDYAWALRYVAGIREPEIAWAAIAAGLVTVLPRDTPVTDVAGQCTPRQRAASLGKEVHARFESWDLGRSVDWYDLPGRIAASGQHLLPAPGQCRVIETERGIGDVPLVGEHTSTGIEVDGVRWAGNRDLLVRASQSEIERLDLQSDWLLVDYKTTRSIRDYAKSSEDLAHDVQRCLYAIDTCRVTGESVSYAQWLYLETAKVRRALAVRTVVSRQQALDVVCALTPTVRRIDAITHVEDAEQNTLHCDAYGGCAMHESMGGPCTARRSVGAMIQRASITKGNRSMASIAELKAQFAAQAEGKPAPTTDAAAPAAVAEAPAARKPRAPKVTASAAPTTPATGTVATVVQLSAELAAAQAELTAATDKVATILTAIREAVSA
jgi:hypothetical protein